MVLVVLLALRSLKVEFAGYAVQFPASEALPAERRRSNSLKIDEKTLKNIEKH